MSVKELFFQNNGYTLNCETLNIENTNNSTSTTTGALIVDGGCVFKKNLYLSGNLHINDLDDDPPKIIFDQDVGEIESTEANAELFITNMNLVIENTTEASSITTGSLVVSGGVGINGEVHIGSYLKIYDTSDSASISSGAVNLLGGMSIQKNLHIGGNCAITGALSKGTGSFLINHPDPNKKNWKLKHCFVESNTAGDNIYRYQIIPEDYEFTVLLPDYFDFLNENPQVWISSNMLNCRAVGHVEKNKCICRCNNLDSIYNILVIGTRKDDIAKNFWTGAEIPPE